jgi:hypothetical protein
MDWYPAPGEDLKLRTLAAFATGAAAPVAGLRSYRDTGHRDIEGDLDGWPPGPRFQPHGRGSRAAGTAAGAAATALPALLNLAYGLLGGQGRGLSVPEGMTGKPEEPENEVEDFPVIWADPGATARRLPWQLDPSRRPPRYRVDAVLTDRRLLVLGIAPGAGLAPAEVLHEIPAELIAAGRQMPYSERGGDLRITFTDGSWTRWRTGTAAALADALRG